MNEFGRKTEVHPIVGNEKEERSESTLAGKYMTFKLAREEYGLQILKVREIIGLLKITKVPKADKAMRGVINLRGRVIPVVDLRLKFGMEEIETTDQTVIIVVQIEQQAEEYTVGIIVDEVLEVLDIQPENIEPTPNFGGGMTQTDCILGIGKSEERIIFLLNIQNVLLEEETIDAMKEITEREETAMSMNSSV